MDKYSSFSALAEAEVHGRDYRIRSRRTRVREWAVLAPHGGGIEPGTSEIAYAVSGNTYSFYAFEGMKRRNNGELHITSACFDEPTGLSVATSANRVLAIHGEDSKRAVVFLGGRDAVARKRLRKFLQRRGFTVERHANQNLEGVLTSNICNRCRSGAGVQVELSRGLRQLCFDSLSRTGRRIRTPVFDELVAAIREALDEQAV
jgi:phage replication-related protein YjqB (UPF0714/DUF867 family)